MLSLGLFSPSVESVQVISLCFRCFFTCKMHMGKCMLRGLNDLMHENIKICKLHVIETVPGV